MKHTILLSFLLTAAALTLSCEKESWIDPNRVTGEGEIVTLPLQLSSYSKIVLEGVADLQITLGGEESSVLKAQQNIVEVLTWEVSSENLTIGLKKGVSLHNHEEICFELNTPRLTKLVHEGVGEVHLAGPGQEDMEIDFRGIGNVFAYGLMVDACVVLNSGTGDCKVRVNEILDVDISSLGNVYYQGTPEINCSDSGLGQLINDN